MKKLLLVLTAIIIFIACKNGSDSNASADSSATDSTAGTATTPKEDNITYPYTANYSSKFEAGNNEHAAIVLALEKAWEDGDLN